MGRKAEGIVLMEMSRWKKRILGVGVLYERRNNKGIRQQK